MNCGYKQYLQRCSGRWSPGRCRSSRSAYPGNKVHPGWSTHQKKRIPVGYGIVVWEARAGIGGGICQISNLIHWLVIHSPLTVIERYHHSFDPFPDDGRVLPFGSGATVFYNYRDYQFRNDTTHTFQINLWFSEKCLEGELRIDQELDYAYHVFEKEHQFLKIDNQFFRKNEIWREKILKFESGKVVDTELLTKNFARVTYTPEQYVEATTRQADHQG
ncbi:VanW family protein [Paraflavitalea speifideaquila]|uniref:VanW family protein n=1 Tax=Paraflavitalea speifideaquila TaxID=3076558 RepID=UPI0028EC57B3|nr:VanW family protein [Paraflavitalea speifideiaquila]